MKVLHVNHILIVQEKIHVDQRVSHQQILNGTFHEGDFYCKMLENMTCATDEMCQSGACFENVCLDKKLAPGSDAFCDTNGDCTNDICAYSEYDS